MTCWRGLRDWQKAGAWEKAPPGATAPIARRQPDRLVASRGRFEQRACGFLGGPTGRNPTDRSKAAVSIHLLTDAQGIPLSVQLSGAQVHDSQRLRLAGDHLPALRGKVGRPRQGPALVQGNRAYGNSAHHRWLCNLGITDRLTRQGTPHGSGLGKTRWVIEHSLSWLHQFRRLHTRHERRADIHEAFLILGCALICHRNLENSFC
jgi:transposase